MNTMTTPQVTELCKARTAIKVSFPYQFFFSIVIDYVLDYVVTVE